MIMTRVLLKPLRKIAQLKDLRACNCVGCDCDSQNNTFTLTFQLNNADGEEILQDLSIIFEKHIPKIYLSSPYIHGNAKNEGRYEIYGQSCY